MTTIFYADANTGRCVGGFGDGAIPPSGSVETDKSPKHGDDIWDGSNWNEDPDEKEKRENKAKKDASAPQLEEALARLVLGQPMNAQDIKAAEDFLA